MNIKNTGENEGIFTQKYNELLAIGYTDEQAEIFAIAKANGYNDEQAFAKAILVKNYLLKFKHYFLFLV